VEYTCEIEIDLPQARVIELFDDADNLKEWQEGLVSFTHRSGEAGQPGAVSDLVFQMGKRKIEMVETIERRNLPEEFTAIFTAKGVWNRNANFFEARGDKTIWLQKNEFRCTGIMMRLMTVLMPGMFKKQSLKYMVAFKAFAEGAPPN